jgi:hypothetical protein
MGQETSEELVAFLRHDPPKPCTTPPFQGSASRILASLIRLSPNSYDRLFICNGMVWLTILVECLDLRGTSYPCDDQSASENQTP